jgi:nitronate monooxygenase
LEIGEEAGTPVVAAGGIGSGRGVAGVLAMGGAGAWIGTRFCATKESLGSDSAKRRLLESDETATVHTRVFDLAQGIPWLEEFPGRALRNDFTNRWHGREDELSENLAGAKEDLREAREMGDFSENYIYAGQSVGLISDVPSAGELVERLASEAEARLRLSAKLFD